MTFNRIYGGRFARRPAQAYTGRCGAERWSERATQGWPLTPKPYVARSTTTQLFAKSVSIVRFNVAFDLVHCRIERGFNVSAVGNIRKRLLEGQRGGEIGRCRRTNQTLLIAQIVEDFQRTAGCVVFG